MEFSLHALLSSPIMLAVLCILPVPLIYCWYCVAYAPFSFFKKRGIKGPVPKPLFGNALMFGTEKEPTKLYMDLVKNYGKLSGYYIGRIPVFLVTDSEMLKQILVKQFDNFTDRFSVESFEGLLKTVLGGLPADLTLMPGDQWRQVRRLVSPTFSSKSLRLMTPLVEKSCVALTQRLERAAKSEENLEVKAVFSQFTLETILSTAFGHQVDILGGNADKDELYQATKAFAELLNEGSAVSTLFISLGVQSFIPAFLNPLLGMISGPLLSYYSKPIYRVAQLARSLVKARRQMPTSDRVDFMQLMINASVDEGSEQEGGDSKVNKKSLTDEEVVSMANVFIQAGFETTSNLLGFTAYLLALNPDKQEMLLTKIDEYYAENEEADLYTAAHNIPYVEWVLQESFRVYPPIQQTNRVCTKSCTVGDITIPKGAMIDVPILLLHHLPEYWEEPDQFIPERFHPDEKANHHPMSHMPFGWGPRNCVGLRFAMMEAKMAMVCLLRKVKFERSPETEVPLKLSFGSTLGAAHLKIVARN